MPPEREGVGDLQLPRDIQEYFLSKCPKGVLGAAKTNGQDRLDRN